MTGPFRRWIVRSRLPGCQEILHEAGLEMGEELVVQPDWTPAGGAAAVRVLLEREPRTTAVFVQNDEMSVGVLKERHRLGRRVPDDVAAVGCDDQAFAEHLSPSLSSGISLLSKWAGSRSRCSSAGWRGNGRRPMPCSSRSPLPSANPAAALSKPFAARATMRARPPEPS